MSDDRKYRQRGYQDDGRSQKRPDPNRSPAEPRDPRIPRDPRVPNMPGFRQVFRCARCGNVESQAIDVATRCTKCGVELHACIHCGSFDPGATFECREAIPKRISPKDAGNDCPRFEPRVNVERETGSTAAASDATSRKAFDDLFKF